MQARQRCAWQLALDRNLTTAANVTRLVAPLMIARGHGRIVHVDIDASEINKNKFAHIPIHTDVRAFLRAINPLAAPGDWRQWHQQIDEWRASDPMAYDQRDDLIMPQYVIEQFSNLARGEFIMTTGVGQHQMWAAQWTRFQHPRTWITSGGLGSMGYGLPAAMGAQAAHPSKLVVDIDGDGSFLMNIQELACAFTEKLPVKVLLLNNQHLGMVVQWEDRFFAGNRAHTYLGAGADQEPYPDFVTLTRGFRCGSRRVAAKGDLDAALEEMLDSMVPYVLDVMVPYQEHVLPMIPSGRTVRDIIKA